nr:serine/arginine repetitive matrix protein 1-like [Aegilops tauschii subsp. strangulata]
MWHRRRPSLRASPPVRRGPCSALPGPGRRRCHQAVPRARATGSCAAVPSSGHRRRQRLLLARPGCPAPPEPFGLAGARRTAPPPMPYAPRRPPPPRHRCRPAAFVGPAPEPLSAPCRRPPPATSPPAAFAPSQIRPGGMRSTRSRTKQAPHARISSSRFVQSSFRSDLTTPIPEDADAEMLEARHVQLVENAKKLANMRRLSEAYQREMHRAVGGTPAPGGPSRIGTVRQRSVAIASLFGADRPVYTTPAENIRAAQAAVEELDNFEGEERRQMAERVQRLLDAAAEQQEAGCHTEAPHRQNDDLPPR